MTSSDRVPDVRWAVSPIDWRCHAFTARTAARAEKQGYAVALCTHAVAARIVAADVPSGSICMGCATVVASELPDPGSGGPAM